MKITNNKFPPLKCSSAFLSCAIPLNLDTYRNCEYGCTYCFMRNRVIGKRNKKLTVPNIKWLKNKFHKIYDEKEYNPKNLIETMLHNKIDIHCGTKSDPFQPQEKEKQYTKQTIELCNSYDQHIIFTTKSDTYHQVPVDPKKHSFQLSITNHYNDKFLEPHVPAFEKRVQFYNQLKDEGFKVGLRFEPFIPNITDVIKCLEYFDEPDVVHISKLNFIPQLNNDKLMKYIGITKEQTMHCGTRYMKPEILYEYYLKEVFQYLEDNNYNYTARNAFIGNQNCCCGDKLTHKTNTFDPYHLYHKYGDNWNLEDAIKEMGNLKDCDCRFVFTSNRWYNNITVEDFYSARYNRKTGGLNPKYIPRARKAPHQTTLDNILT